jgi:hypothetical protein
VIRLLIARIIRLFGKIGMSFVVAATDGSDPKRIKATDDEVLVTTAVSPPPANATFAAVVVADIPTVPEGRKGLVEPIGIFINL